MSTASRAADCPAGPLLPGLPALAARTGALLAAGVPLTLLIDLAEPLGPRSCALYSSEGGSARWLGRA